MSINSESLYFFGHSYDEFFIVYQKLEVLGVTFVMNCVTYLETTNLDFAVKKKLFHLASLLISNIIATVSNFITVLLFAVDFNFTPFFFTKAI